MPTFSKFQSFVEALAEGKHDLSADVLEVALTNVAPDNLDAVLTDLTEIVYTNLSARTLANVSSAQTAGVYKLDADNKVLTASGAVASFRYVVIFNQDAANDELIAWGDKGAAVTMSDTETFTINFDAAGILTLE